MRRGLIVLSVGLAFLVATVDARLDQEGRLVWNIEFPSESVDVRPNETRTFPLRIVGELSCYTDPGPISLNITIARQGGNPNASRDETLARLISPLFLHPVVVKEDGTPAWYRLNWSATLTVHGGNGQAENVTHAMRWNGHGYGRPPACTANGWTWETPRGGYWFKFLEYGNKPSPPPSPSQVCDPGQPWTCVKPSSDVPTASAGDARFSFKGRASVPAEAVLSAMAVLAVGAFAILNFLNRRP